MYKYGIIMTTERAYLGSNVTKNKVSRVISRIRIKRVREREGEEVHRENKRAFGLKQSSLPTGSFFRFARDF